eukprot:3172995-Pyramimonas_sp.AAC.1
MSIGSPWNRSCSETCQGTRNQTPQALPQPNLIYSFAKQFRMPIRTMQGGLTRASLRTLATPTAGGLNFERSFEGGLARTD